MSLSLQIITEDSNLDEFGSAFYFLELKGSKHYTKSIGIEANLEASVECFKTEFSCLDWDYMMERDNGELVCDIGITHHALASDDGDALVGLWRLDCLEASFGASGFRSGNLHTINTLGLYGGLQAEMQKSRLQRTHIVSRSAYNLAYEVTRQMDNGRDRFKAQDAYDISVDYLNETQQVINVYRDEASYKSFGVRDEFCVGGQTLDVIQDSLEDLVRVYSLHAFDNMFSTRSGGRIHAI